MSAKRFFNFLMTNFYIRNLVILIIIVFAMIFGILNWLDSYTMHNQAIEVPDVKGMQVSVAAPILERSKLRYQVVDSIYSKDVRPGAVVEQIPVADSKVKENRIVFLTVNAKNAQTVELPDVIEYSSRQARGMLNSLGFRADSIIYVEYEQRDLVVNVLYDNKEVNAGQRIPYGAQLVLEVGDGIISAPRDTIPALEELTEDDMRWLE